MSITAKLGNYFPPIPLADVTGAASSATLSAVISGATPVGRASTADGLTSGHTIAVSDVDQLQNDLDAKATQDDLNSVVNGPTQVANASVADRAIADGDGNPITSTYLTISTAVLQGDLDANGYYVRNVNTLSSGLVTGGAGVVVFDLSNDDGGWKNANNTCSMDSSGNFTAASFYTLGGTTVINNYDGLLGTSIAWSMDGSGTLSNGQIIWSQSGDFGVNSLYLINNNTWIHADGSGALADQKIVWDTAGNLTLDNDLTVNGNIILPISHHTSSFSFLDSGGTSGSVLHTINSATATTAALPTSGDIVDGVSYELKNQGAGTCTITTLDSSKIFFNNASSSTKTCITGENIRLVFSGAEGNWEVR